MITFPSMHTGIAALALYAVWTIRLARVLIAPFAVGLMVTSLTNGGHYLVDCFGGLAVAAMAIFVTNTLYAARLPVSPPVPRVAWSAMRKSGIRFSEPVVRSE